MTARILAAILLLAAPAWAQVYTYTNNVLAPDPNAHPIGIQQGIEWRYTIFPVSGTTPVTMTGLTNLLSITDERDGQAVATFTGELTSATSIIYRGDPPARMQQGITYTGRAKTYLPDGTEVNTIAHDRWTLAGAACSTCYVVSNGGGTADGQGPVSNVVRAATNGWDAATGRLTVGTNYPNAYGVTNQPAGVPTLTAGGVLLIGTNVPAAAGGGGATGLVTIATYTADGSTNAFTFNSIPQGFAALVIMHDLQCNYPTNYALTTTLGIRLNGKATNYYYAGYNFSAGTQSGIAATNTGNAIGGAAPRLDGACSTLIRIYDYSSETATNKAFICEYGGLFNPDVGTIVLGHVSVHNVLRGIGAVTSITVYTLSTTNFAAGSSSLMGITK